MRSLALFCFFALFSCVCATLPAGHNPPAGAEENFCLLSSIAFTNGITVVGNFDSKKYSYSLNCPNLPLNTIVTPTLADPGSTAEIAFDGVDVNTKAKRNAISNNGNVELSPNTQSNLLTFQTGVNTLEVGVSCNGMGLPNPCYYKYTFTCSCGPASVVGDPQFTGLRGQNYQVHGVAGEIYNIVSDPLFQLNARFVFLESGKCPMLNGRKLKGCWSHPGSYLGEIGLKTKAGDRVEIISGTAEQGFDSVSVNGKALAVGDTVFLKDELGAVSLNNTHAVEMTVGKWTFNYENSDRYVNQQVRVSSASGLRSHGLLGQTWKDVVYSSPVKYVQGQVDDYVIRDADLFGDNFVYNMFN